MNRASVKVLPNVFTKNLYTSSPWVYLIYNRGTKHKVWLEKVSGRNNYALFSREWKSFITDSRYMRVNTLHFIRAAPDEYYVTGYHNDGSECNGYDLDRILPAQFFPNLVTNRVRVMISDLLRSTVTLRRVPVAQNRHGHVLSGQGWHILVYVERIQRVLRMPLNGRAPFVISPIDIEHHNDEKDDFYSPIVAYVTDCNRLTIPWWFVDGNKMQTVHNAYLVYDEERFYVDLDWVFHADRPDRKNHMNIIAPWRVILDQCHFDENKMVRFKLIDSIPNAF
ncbi:hypothetical protein Tco_0964543 [Tanacetum coccineum]